MGRCRPRSGPARRSRLPAAARPAPYPAGMTITASTSPSCIDAMRGSDDPGRSASTPRPPRTRSGAGRMRATPSSSTHATSRPAPPLPWKMNPNRKMKISGKASVQNRAARSRTKLRTFAMVRARRARIGDRLSRAALDRSGRGRRLRGSGDGHRGRPARRPAPRTGPAATRSSPRHRPCTAGSSTSSRFIETTAGRAVSSASVS